MFISMNKLHLSPASDISDVYKCDLSLKVKGKILPLRVDVCEQCHNAEMLQSMGSFFHFIVVVRLLTK